MAVKTPIHFEGNLAADPELSEPEDGKTRAQFPVAVNERQFSEESGQWENVGEPVYHRTTVFGKQAENVVASLRKGDPVVVNSDLQFNVWRDDEGNKRTGTQVTAHSVSPSLRYGTVEVNRSVPKRDGPEAVADGPHATRSAEQETGPAVQPAQEPVAASWRW